MPAVFNWSLNLSKWRNWLFFAILSLSVIASPASYGTTDASLKDVISYDQWIELLKAKLGDLPELKAQYNPIQKTWLAADNKTHLFLAGSTARGFISYISREIIARGPEA